jgi:glycine reductase
MAREFERRGLPTAVVTALPTIAQRMRVNRIVPGAGIPYPLGDPSLSQEQEFRQRLAILRAALGALETAVARPTLFAP